MALRQTTADPIERLLAALERMSPGAQLAFLDRLPPGDRILVERVLARHRAAGWRSEPLTWAQHLVPGIRPWRYVRHLSRKFREAATGEGSKRQLWALPGRYGKTTWATKYGPGWALDVDPTTRLILATYGKTLSVESAVELRDLLVEHSDELSVRLHADVRRADRWRTQQGGGLLAASIGSSTAGFPADGLVIDDPFKDMEEAHSAARRERVYRFATTIARIRLESDRAWMIVAGYRMHEHDLHARLADESGEEWEWVSLPAIAGTDDPLGRAPGEPLEPERFGLTEVRARAAVLGSYYASAMEQQNPTPEEGNEILRDWWRLGDSPPARFDTLVSSWDLKLLDSEVGDYAVGQVWGKVGGDYWGLDQWRGKWGTAIVRVALAHCAVRHPRIGLHLVEHAGRASDFIPTCREPDASYVLSEFTADEVGIPEDERRAVQDRIRRGVPGVVGKRPKVSKEQRVRDVAPLVEAGHVHLFGLWRQSLINEAAQFPNGEHDDQVDAFTQAISYLRGGGGSISVVAPRKLADARAPGAAGRPGGRKLTDRGRR